MERIKSAPTTPLLEWVFATVGVIIVGGMLAFNVVQAISDKESPPDVQITAQDSIPISRGFLVPIQALNVGGSSAAALMIEGTLNDSGKELEKSEMTLDYVPPHSQKKGGLFFTHDPQQHELKLRVLGYQSP